MQAGVILPGGTADEQLRQTVLAEASGWDGVFVWEAAYGIDAWTLLGAMAAVTERIRLGTLLTPLPWRRPWKLASQVATLDQLSGGRAILTVGLGALNEDLPVTGEVIDVKTRAQLLDEGIDLLRALWAGNLSYRGAAYEFECELPDQLEVGRPVQERVPIWVVGVWPRERSMRRVLRCDGVVPQFDLNGRAERPDDVRDIHQWLTAHGARQQMDIIAQGESPSEPDAASAVVQPWADAGCTWWLETNWEMPHHVAQRMAQVRERISAGPPAIARMR